MKGPDSTYADTLTDRVMKGFILFIGISAWLSLVWIMF